VKEDCIFVTSLSLSAQKPILTELPAKRNLGPGSYHFSVMATDTNGVWSDKVATAEFAILPAFYQTRWFLNAVHRCCSDGTVPALPLAAKAGGTPVPCTHG
jgi:hypothetical protein